MTVHLGVWRPSDGTWHVAQSKSESEWVKQFGQTRDIPVAGDYDGDGKTDMAVFRPATGVWFVLQSSTGKIVQQQLGLADDIRCPLTLTGMGKRILLFASFYRHLVHQSQQQSGKGF